MTRIPASVTAQRTNAAYPGGLEVHTFHRPASVPARRAEAWQVKIRRHLEANGWTVQD